MEILQKFCSICVGYFFKKPLPDVSYISILTSYNVHVLRTIGITGIFGLKSAVFEHHAMSSAAAWIDARSFRVNYLN